jgi:phage-related protein
MSDWTVAVISKAADELEAMPADMQARFLRIASLIEERGMLAMREPYVKHLEGKLWEMRMTGRDGIARAVYFTATPKRAIVVRAFIKKTQKTPSAELTLARQRMKEWEYEQN